MLSLVLGMFYILNAPCSNTVHMMVLCNTHISEEVTYLKSVWLRFKFQEEMLQTNEIHSLAISELCPGHWPRHKLIQLQNKNTVVYFIHGLFDQSKHLSWIQKEEKNSDKSIHIERLSVWHMTNYWKEEYEVRM